MDFGNIMLKLAASLSDEEAVELLDSSIKFYKTSNDSNRDESFKKMCMTAAIIAGIPMAREQGIESVEKSLDQVSEILKKAESNPNNSHF